MDSPARRPRRTLPFAPLVLAAAASCGALRGGEGYVEDIDTSGTVVDPSTWLLLGAEGAAGTPPGVLALATPDGAYLLLEPGRSASDSEPDDDDPGREGAVRGEIASLRVGQRVRVTGELYERDGLRGIEVERLVRE